MFNWLRVIREACTAAAPTGEPVWPPAGIESNALPSFAWLALVCLVVYWCLALFAIIVRVRWKQRVGILAGMTAILLFDALNYLDVRNASFSFQGIRPVWFFTLAGSFLTISLVALVVGTFTFSTLSFEKLQQASRLALWVNLAIASTILAGWSAVLYAMTSC